MNIIKKIFNYATSTWYNTLIYTTLVFSLAALILSDNRLYPRHKGEGVHPDYAHCAESFTELTGKKVITPIQPEHIRLNNGAVTLGVTYMSRWYPTEIEINIDSWNKRSDDPLRQCAIVWHELAHAQCGANHVEVELADGCSASIMGYAEDDSACFHKHLDLMFKSLQDVCKE